jgi:ribosome-associated protein
MRKVANLCDYFVICSALSDRQVKAIADYVEDELKMLGNRISFRDGHRSADWIVLDVSDVVVHVFQKDLREFYGLEYLWQEAKIVNWSKKK